MAVITFTPISMSIGIGGNDSQPIHLNRQGLLADDVTSTWSTLPGNPSYRGAVITSTNPLLISFKITDGASDLLSCPYQLSLKIGYSNQGSAATKLNAILLPTQMKRSNTDYWRNRTIGYSNSNVVTSLVSRCISAGLEVGNIPIFNSALANAIFSPSFNGTAPFIGMNKTTGIVEMPLALTMLKSIMSSSPTPVITFAIYPNSDSGNLFIVEPASSATAMISQLSITTETNNSGQYDNTISPFEYSPITRSPSVSVKQENITDINYSMGLSIFAPMNSSNYSKNTNSFGAFAAEQANLGVDIFSSRDSLLNMVSNPLFIAGFGSCTCRALFGSPHTGSFIQNSFSGWTPYSGKSGSSNVSISQQVLTPGSSGITQPCMGNRFEQIAGLAPVSIAANIEMNDHSNSTDWFNRSISGKQPVGTYVQYSSLAQEIGDQFNEEEEYLLEAWVKPYRVSRGAEFSSGSLGAKLRMSITLGFRSAEDPEDGFYKTIHTGGFAGSSSLDAWLPSGANTTDQVNNAEWQRIWVKFKNEKTNSIQKIRSLSDSASSHNNGLISDAEFTLEGGGLQQEYQSFAEIRFDNIPTDGSVLTTNRYDIKFLLAGVSITNLNNREYDSDSGQICDYKPRCFNIQRVADDSSNLGCEDPTFYIPLRGNTQSPYNTSMYSASQHSWITGGATLATQDISYYGGSRWASLHRINPADNINIGGYFSSPRLSYLYRFSPYTQGGKYARGSHLAIRTGENFTSVLNPNEGSIEFLYCPLYSIEADPARADLLIYNHPRPSSVKKFGSTNTGRPYTFLEPNDADSIDNNLYSPYRYAIFNGGPRHILSFLYTPNGFATDNLNGNKAFNGSLYSGSGVSFFRQGRMIYCLIYEAGRPESQWDNQYPLFSTNSRRNKHKFIMLKYLIPENMMKFKSSISSVDSFPSWYNIKLTWGSRIELVVNGRVEDSVNVSGLFSRPSRGFTQNTMMPNSIPNTFWAGTVGMISESVTFPNPYIYTDSMIITDVLVSSNNKAHTFSSSSLESGAAQFWNRIENLNIRTQGSVAGITHGT